MMETTQRIRIVRSADGAVQFHGILPDQQLVQMNGKLHVLKKSQVDQLLKPHNNESQGDDSIDPLSGAQSPDWNPGFHAEQPVILAHQVEVPAKLEQTPVKIKPYSCRLCEMHVSNKQSLIRHMQRWHQITELPRTGDMDAYLNKCLEGCDASFYRKSHLIEHLKDIHNKEMIIENYTFGSFEEFQAWRHATEESGKCRYVITNGKKKVNDGRRIYYDCSRSGVYKERQEKIRQAKKQGSKKINRNCTSHILLFEKTRSKKCYVKFCKTHYGHTIDEQHLGIPYLMKGEIAAKIKQGLPFEQILEYIREKNDNLKPTKYDLHNIKNKFNQAFNYDMRHKDDASSVHLWVEEMLQTGVANPVFYYKKLNALDADFPLTEEDMCLIIMNSAQRKLLRKFAHQAVCVHAVKECGFQLVTIIAVDSFGVWIPCCSMLTNGQDSIVYNVLFSKVKEHLGVITCSLFIDNLIVALYMAWTVVMGNKPRRIYCPFSVDIDWKKHLSLIEGIDRQKSVYGILKDLQRIPNPDDFLHSLEEAQWQLLKDPKSSNFGKYFTKKYVRFSDRWASSFLKKNIPLEGLQKAVRYLDGRKLKRLDRTIADLQSFTYDRQLERLTKLTKGDDLKKHNGIIARHRASLCTDYEVMDLEEGVWQIIESKNIEKFCVQKMMSKMCCSARCNDCQVCLHSYDCSCPDFRDHAFICKHVHYIVQRISSVGHSECDDCFVDEDFCDEDEIVTLRQCLDRNSVSVADLRNQILNRSLALIRDMKGLVNVSSLKTVCQRMENINDYVDDRVAKEKLENSQINREAVILRSTTSEHRYV